MNYLALGDSMSIDDYTGEIGGGAASQFARLVQAQRFQDLTYDGCTTEGVLKRLQRVEVEPSVITLTAGGNDFLLAAFYCSDPGSREGYRELVEAPTERLRQIATNLAGYDCSVIMNTIYDPTDGDDGLGGRIGVSGAHRLAFHELNDNIRNIARSHGFHLSDLHALFANHGVRSEDCWIVGEIEPNLPGATAIASEWHRLFVAGNSQAGA